MKRKPQHPMRLFACFAATLDGKITIPTRQGVTFSGFGSQTDLNHLKTIREQADVILIGGKTFRAFPRRRCSLDLTHCPRHGIITRGRHIHQAVPPDSPIFSEDPPLRITLFTLQLPSDAEKAAYPDSVEWISLGEAIKETDLCTQVTTIRDTFAKHGCKSLLLEGGGEILAMFLAAQAVNDMYLTLCPYLVGGDTVASLVGGEGFFWEHVPKTSFIDVKQIDQELFLHVAIHYPTNRL